jgi:uncharacterized membrane protein
VAMLISSIVPLYIMVGPMECGLFICLLRCQQRRALSFEMLFDGFHFFAQSLLATMLWAVPFLVFLVIWYVGFLIAAVSAGAAVAQQGAGQRPNVEALLGTMLGVTGVFYLALIGVALLISVLTFFLYPLIVDRELTGTQAFVLSINAALGNLGGVLGVVLLEVLLGLAGVLLCFVGWIFLMPLGFAMVSVAYRQVFPDDDRLAMRPPDTDSWDDDDDDRDAETGIQIEPRPRRQSDADER